MARESRYRDGETRRRFWSAVASAARHRLGLLTDSCAIQSAVAAPLCRRSPYIPQSAIRNPHSRGGFTLIELVITVTVLAILTLAAVPLAQNAVKRQKEQQLRAALREMREAIDQFHREALAAPVATAQNPNPQSPNPPNPAPQSNDPRVRVFISDQTIFTVDNPDRYPPDLETLVKGVNVVPFPAGAGLGGRGNLNVNATDVGSAVLSEKKKVYLRAVPIDPMTGKAEWDLRSCYDPADAASWGGENVFDVHSKSKDTALNGEKYSDW